MDRTIGVRAWSERVGIDMGMVNGVEDESEDNSPGATELQYPAESCCASFLAWQPRQD